MSRPSDEDDDEPSGRSNVSPIQLGPFTCPNCHKRHWGRVPEACARCGVPLERPLDPDRDDSGERTRDGRLRFLLVVGCSLITFAGMIFRQLPESDPGHAARARAKKECRDAMDAVLTRRFDLARQAAEDAVGRYDRFPEARTVLSLAHLGQGAYAAAAREALWAQGDFADGRADPVVFRHDIAIDKVATRARCVAEAAVGTPEALGPLLFDALLAVSGAPTCTEARAVLDNAPVAVRSVMTRAISTCSQAFSCVETAPTP